MKTTAKGARATLSAIEDEIAEAEVTYDDALGVGVGIEAAEGNLKRLRDTRERLTRQIDILREREALDAKDAAQRARQAADAEVIRCRAIAAEAFQQFAPVLRGKVEELADFADAHIGGALRVLEAAAAEADRLSGRPLVIPPKQLSIMSYEIHSSQLSFMAPRHLGKLVSVEYGTTNAGLRAIECYADIFRASAPAPGDR